MSACSPAPRNAWVVGAVTHGRGLTRGGPLTKRGLGGEALMRAKGLEESQSGHCKKMTKQGGVMG
eukprot:5338295-Pleurochrysis_carterae.AAC.1